MKWTESRRTWKVLFPDGKIDHVCGSTPESVAKKVARSSWGLGCYVRRIAGTFGGEGAFEVIRKGRPVLVFDVEEDR